MTTVQEDYSPVAKGDTLKPFLPVFSHKDTSAFNFTGLTISMKMALDEEGVQGLKTCNGTWTAVDAINGKASYAYQDSDVDTAGTWTLFIKFTDSNGKFVHADKKILEIEQAP